MLTRSVLLVCIAAGFIFAADALMLSRATPSLSLDTPVEGPRLALYASLAEKDPIFGLPGTDPEALRDVRDELIAMTARLDGLIETPSDQQLDNILFPTDLIAALADTETARRDLSEAPSPQRAQQYHAALVRTLTEYDVYAARLEKTFASMEDKVIHFRAATTSPSRLARVLSETRKHAGVLLSVETRRYRCLRGYPLACLGLIAPHPRESAHSQTPAPMPSRISAHLSLAQGLIASSAISSSESTETATRNGDGLTSPLVALKAASCSPQFDTTWNVAWWQKRDGHAPQARFLPINDFYFSDLAKYPDTGRDGRIKRLGIDYRFQPQNAYLCAEYMSDASRIFGTLAVHYALRSAPLFLALSPGDPAYDAELARLESQVANPAHALSEADVARYLRGAMAWVTAHRLSESSSIRLMARRVTELELIVRTRSAWLDGSLGHYGYTSRVLERYGRDKPLSLDFVLLTHSGLSFILLLERTHFDTEEDPFSYATDSYAGAKTSYTSYESSLKDLFSPKELIEYVDHSEAMIAESLQEE